MALWGGRFQGETSALFKLFNDSLPVDYRLFEQDVVGSIAWADAIASVGIITATECSDLKKALNDLLVVECPTYNIEYETPMLSCLDFFV